MNYKQKSLIGTIVMLVGIIIELIGLMDPTWWQLGALIFLIGVIWCSLIDRQRLNEYAERFGLLEDIKEE